MRAIILAVSLLFAATPVLASSEQLEMIERLEQKVDAFYQAHENSACLEQNTYSACQATYEVANDDGTTFVLSNHSGFAIEAINYPFLNVETGKVVRVDVGISFQKDGDVNVAIGYLSDHGGKSRLCLEEDCWASVEKILPEVADLVK